MKIYQQYLFFGALFRGIIGKLAVVIRHHTMVTFLPWHLESAQQLPSVCKTKLQHLTQFDEFSHNFYVSEKSDYFLHPDVQLDGGIGWARCGDDLAELDDVARPPAGRPIMFADVKS